jgi:hypothetical protein
LLVEGLFVFWSRIGHGLILMSVLLSRLLKDGLLTSWSNLSAAASCNPGDTWEYVSRVVTMELCPSLSETILG